MDKNNHQTAHVIFHFSNNMMYPQTGMRSPKPKRNLNQLQAPTTIIIMVIGPREQQHTAALTAKAPSTQSLGRPLATRNLSLTQVLKLSMDHTVSSFSWLYRGFFFCIYWRQTAGGPETHGAVSISRETVSDTQLMLDLFNLSGSNANISPVLS